MTENNDFGNILKDLRVNKGLSQSQLAKKLGISPSLVGLYEQNRRKPSYEMLENIADFFNVSVSLLCGSNDLTDAEKTILDIWRKSSPNDKNHILAYFIGLQEMKKRGFDYGDEV